MEGTVRLLFFALACLDAFSAAPLSDNASSIAVISPSPTAAHGFGGVLAATASMGATIPDQPGDLPGDLPGDPPASASCPDKLKICWQDNPPYFMKSNRTGVFKDVLQNVLKECCSGGLPELDFAHEVGDENCTESSVDVILPRLLPMSCHGQFIKVVQSPGIALVLNREKLVKDAQENVWNEILQLWTVLVLALLLATISGIVIWALDSFFNPEKFPSNFPRGATEGIWWAFVTMTTVGYGDKTPRSILARIFAIVWMFVGLSLVSLLTATMTSALTSGKVRNTADVFNKKIGVLDGGQGYEEGIKQGADVQKYKALKELYQALLDENIDGIMVDVFKASYSANHILELDENLVMAKIFEFPFILGFCVTSTGRDKLQFDNLQCIQASSSKSFRSEVYHTVRKYVQGAALKGMDREASGSKSGSWQTDLNVFSTEKDFYRLLTILGSILGSLIFLGCIYETVMWRRRQTRALHAGTRGRKATYKLHTNTMEFQRMMENLNELEKSLAKVAEFKELYHKLKTDAEQMEYADRKKSKHDSNKAHTCHEDTTNTYTNVRLENFRSR